MLNIGKLFAKGIYQLNKTHLFKSRLFSSIYTISDTIFALSSGHGKCGVAVIRISGSKSAEVILKMTKQNKLPRPRRALLSPLFDHRSGERLDKALILWFPRPDSFTGEDVCELHVHGGKAVIAAVFDTLGSIPGLRPAEPGDFTKTAFMNNKLDLTEVEGLGDLIHAETEAQRRQALKQMDGALSGVINLWSKLLLQCLAHVEALIDFGEDQHIEDGVLDNVRITLTGLCKEVSQHLNDNRRGERLRNGVNLAIIGEPNVGKSSLLNLITHRPAAIVSPIAGTTRDVVETALDIGGYPVVLSDTAGLCSTDDIIEKEGMKRARDKALNADLILHIVDISTIPDKTNENLSDNLKDFLCGSYIEGLDLSSIKNKIIVINKRDLGHETLVKKIKKLSTESLTHDHKVSIISCKTGEGMEEFLNALTGSIKELCENEASAYSPSLTQERHRIHVTKCLEDMENARNLLDRDVVFAAEYLRFAMNQLGKLTGKIGAEDILDVIFKDFCIGK